MAGTELDRITEMERRGMVLTRDEQMRMAEARKRGMIPSNEVSELPEALQGPYKFFTGVEDMIKDTAVNLNILGGDDETRQRAIDYRKDREAGIQERAPAASDGFRFTGQMMAGGPGSKPAGAINKIASKVAQEGAETLGESTIRMGTEGALYGLTAQSGDTPSDIANQSLQNFNFGAMVPGSLHTAKKALKATAGRMFPITDDAVRADQFAKDQNLTIMGEDLTQSGIARASGKTLDAVDPSNALGEGLLVVTKLVGDVDLEVFNWRI
jgi:hypothetical protein